SRASGRRASVGFASEALRNRGEENNAAKTSTGRSDGTESFQRSDYRTHAGDFLQPHYYCDGSGAAGERNLRAGAVEGDFVGGGWCARSGHDEAGCARFGLRHVFGESAQMAAGNEGLG